MERFPLKSSVPKMASTYQSVYKKDMDTTNGRSVHAGGDDGIVDLVTGHHPPETTPTSHGTFQLYEHSPRDSSSASAASYIAQYFSSSAGKGTRKLLVSLLFIASLLFAFFIVWTLR